MLNRFQPRGTFALPAAPLIGFVVRSAKEALAAGELKLKVEGEDGSQLSFTFPVEKADAGRAVEHLHLNGWLLRPGKYALEVTADGASAKETIDVYSHVRRSSFR